MHEIIAYNKVTRICIYFIVVFGFEFNYLDLDWIRIFIKVNPLLSGIYTNLLRLFIPSLSHGKCLDFFRKFEPYRPKSPSSSLAEIHSQKDSGISSSSVVQPSMPESEEAMS